MYLFCSFTVDLPSETDLLESFCFLIERKPDKFWRAYYVIFRPEDHIVGIVLQAKVGDTVRAGDVLLTIYANKESRAAVARERLLAAYRWAEHEVVSPPIVHKVIH